MTDKLYLSGLNGIRAIAAISVIISHIGLSLKDYKLPSFGGYALASFGVTMFFALSGFLITYLLLVEKQKTQTIAIQKFYIRRVLRIWPLYYFYLIIVIIVIGFNINKYTWMYFFLLPNIPFALNASSIASVTLPYLAHYWSVGVEEQFYAFWPWLVRYSKKIFRSLVIFAVSFLLLKIVLTLMHAPAIIMTLLHYTRFGCLAMGGIAAYLLIEKNALFIKIFQSKISEIMAWVVFVLIAFNKFHLFSIIDHELVTIATIIIIINQVNNPIRLISLENRVFDYFGKISYGLYVYNPLIIFLVSGFLKEFLTPYHSLNLILIYSITFLIIIAVSHLSYFYFENIFLKFKEKFAMIKSKNSAL